MEEAFIVKWRERVAAGGLDDDDDAATGGYVGGGAGGFGGGGTGVGAVGGGAGLGRRGGGGGGRGSLAPPANLGKLLAEGNTIAAVARCDGGGARGRKQAFSCHFSLGEEGEGIGGGGELQILNFSPFLPPPLLRGEG